MKQTIFRVRKFFIDFFISHILALTLFLCLLIVNCLCSIAAPTLHIGSESAMWDVQKLTYLHTSHSKFLLILPPERHINEEASDLVNLLSDSPPWWACLLDDFPPLFLSFSAIGFGC